ncbi:MAG: hypothetical protein IJX99_08835 [Clostridia bacterium]|nr:hypothetical protein [Clostridia bacterium]
MNKNSGVTLASLSVYIIVSVVVLSSLTFLNINFMSQIAEISQKSEYTNELLKAQASLITDIKAANRVLEYSDKYLKFDNGVEYKIRYRANEARGEQTYDVYELYRNDVLITDKMTNIAFEYDSMHDNYLQEDFVTWITIKMLDTNLMGNDLHVRVGKGY